MERKTVSQRVGLFPYCGNRMSKTDFYISLLKLLVQCCR